MRREGRGRGKGVKQAEEKVTPLHHIVDLVVFNTPLPPPLVTFTLFLFWVLSVFDTC